MSTLRTGRRLRAIVSCRIAVLGWAMLVAAWGGMAQGASLADFRKASFYGSWTGKAQRDGEATRVTSGATVSGGGIVYQPQDLSSKGDCVPLLNVKVLPGNEADALRLLIVDASRTTHQWTYKFPASPTAQFITLTPEGSRALGHGEPAAASVSKAPKLDLAHILEVHVQGNYTGNAPVCVAIGGVELTQPTLSVVPAISNSAPAEQSRPRSGVLPTVQRISTEGAQVIAIDLQFPPAAVQSPAPYVETPGDTIEKVEGTNGLSKVVRDGQAVGYLDTQARKLYAFDKVQCDPLDVAQLTLNSSYFVQSKDDRDYVEGRAPSAVGLKARPCDFALPSMTPLLRYTLYLQMDKPLSDERSYEISFPALDLTPVHLKYVTKKTVSEAVHVSQIGFRADDSVKTGRFSLWMGSSGGSSLKPQSFSVIGESSGRSVLTGKPVLVRSAAQGDGLTPGRSMTGADVYLLDFSTLKAPGRYRLYVPDVGCSTPFQIADSVWQDLFVATMRGFVAQRASVELSAPYTDFSRRRFYHPLDGAKVRLADFTLLQTDLAPADPGEDYRRLAARSAGKDVFPDAIGGYLESGSSAVRRIQSLDATRLQLELCAMFPKYFDRLALTMPGKRDGTLLDECLWNLEFYHALQMMDGGVCGAVIDRAAENPYPVPPTFGTDLLATAPDVYSSYTYAATAARAAAVMQASEPVRAGVYLMTAQKAFAWAEAKLPDLDAPDALAAVVRDRRNLAAVELLSASSDRSYHKVFLETTCLKGANAVSYVPGTGGHDQQEAIFAYARLPGTLVDVALRNTALKLIAQDADAAVASAAQNGWGLASSIEHPNLSHGFFTTLPALSLLRGHYLLRNDAYLKAALQHAQFALGANPSNLCFVTGIGSRSPRNLVHTWTRLARQPAPQGMVPFGPFDPQILAIAELPGVKEHIAPACTPPLDQWPAAECFFDCYALPEQCGYSVQGTLGPAAYLFGYLAAR